MNEKSALQPATPSLRMVASAGGVSVKLITVRGLLTREQIAEFLQVAPDTIYKFVREAKNRVKLARNPIPFRKVGGELRFDIDEIIEWTKPKD